LVDDFQCDNEQSIEVDSTLIEKYNSSGVGYEEKYEFVKTLKYSVPKKHKIIELDSSSWPNERALKISVHNNNSNYNNGFMTKKSIVVINPVFLIRKDMLDDRSTMQRIIRKSYKWQSARGEKRAHRDNRRPMWPGYDLSLMTYHPLFRNMDFLTHGGNFEINFKIKKKHNNYMLTRDEDAGTGFKQCHGFFFLSHLFCSWYQRYNNDHFDVVCEMASDFRGSSSVATNNSTKVEIKSKLKK